MQEDAARRAIAADPADAYARVIFGVVFLLRGDHGAALVEVERALAMTPNLADAHATRGVTLILSGKPADGIASLVTSIRLDPKSPLAWVRQSQISLGYYLGHDYSNAAIVAERVVRSYPNYPSCYRYFAAALGQLGRVADARDALREAMRLAPSSLEMYVYNQPPWMQAEDHALVIEGLRKAGWEDCATPQQGTAMSSKS